MNERVDEKSVHATTTVACNEKAVPVDAIEEWRPVVDWEHKYEVSNHGRVRNKNTQHILMPYGRWGMVHLADGSKGHRIRSTTISPVQCMVRTFCSDYVNGATIKYVDNNPTNTKLSNVVLVPPKTMDDYPDLEWRDVVGYEGFYKVSNTGLIYGILSNTMVKACSDKDGYLGLNLYKRGADGKNVRQSFKVHRLVAAAFLPNPENKPQIDHIDGVKTNNCVENLRWTSSKENINNPVTLAARNASIKEYWKDPENLARRAAKNRSPEFLEALHAAQHKPDFIAKMREVRRKDMRPVICLTNGANTYYDSIQTAHLDTGVDTKTITGACKRYEKGDKRTTPWRPWRGNMVTNFWRWATPEEVAQHTESN